MSDNTSFVIDNDLRTIEIPENFVLGVYHDRDVNTIHFIAPRKYKNIDLSQYSIQINYKNNDNVTDLKMAENIKAGTDNIEFDWTAGKNAFIGDGWTYFNVCFRKIDSKGYDTNEFNTTVYGLKVLKGMEVETTVVPDKDAVDFVGQITSLLQKTSSYATQLGDLTQAISDTKSAASSASASAKAAADSASTAATIAGVGEFAYYIADDGLHLKYKQGGINS